MMVDNMFIKNLKYLRRSDIQEAGGKGASLGEMIEIGVPVPSGFVLLSNAFEYFLKENVFDQKIHSILSTVNYAKITTIENASEEIRGIVCSAKIPTEIIGEVKEEFNKLNSRYIAVRSSATAEDSSVATWAGQLESYLNTTENDLLQNVRKCWASLFSPHAISYQFKNDLHGKTINTAVVVQMMIKSEISGIAFSVHPMTQNKNQIIIEAGLGLGEAIVSGQIMPNSYVVEKESCRIIDRNIRSQSQALYCTEDGGVEWRDISEKQRVGQVLSDDQISELSKIILKIENHFGFPCDIEWALEKDKFWILQSRSITTL